MRGKLIVIEGTDCSGKETQSNLLIEFLHEKGIRIERFSFPNYTSPTGKIVGGPYLGKSYICEGWFPESAVNVDPKVSSLYYAADRRYNIPKINLLLKQGVNIILDRYVYSNMAHQGGKIMDYDERIQMYEWIDKLEFDFLELPKSDINVFLHMPYENVKILKQNRIEVMDQLERDENHLINAEKAYLEIAQKYNFKTIECVKNNQIKSIEQIQNEVCNYIYEQLN